MNPTTTEHDYRFPRRPGAPAAVGAFRNTPSYANNNFHSNHSSNNNNNNTYRPFQQHGGVMRPSPAGLRTELQDLHLDFISAAPQTAMTTDGGARDALLRTSALDHFERATAASFTHTPDEMQRQDPIAMQVWRYFADTKRRLPNQDRMENLTWRMMHLTLRKRRQAEEAR
jgi:GATA-binding protein, other eukaryote